MTHAHSAHTDEHVQMCTYTHIHICTNTHIKNLQEKTYIIKCLPANMHTTCAGNMHTLTPTHIYKGKFVLFNDASRAHWLSYHRLLDIRHMVIVTYFFRGNLLSLHRLLFQISSKGPFICTFPQTGEHIPQSLVDHWLDQKIAQTANATAIQYQTAMQEDPNL